MAYADVTPWVKRFTTEPPGDRPRSLLKPEQPSNS